MRQVIGEFPPQARITHIIQALIDGGVPVEHISVASRTGTERQAIPIEFRNGSAIGALIGGAAGAAIGVLFAVLLAVGAIDIAALGLPANGELRGLGRVWVASFACGGLVGALIGLRAWRQFARLPDDHDPNVEVEITVRGDHLADTAWEVFRQSNADLIHDHRRVSAVPPRHVPHAAA